MIWTKERLISIWKIFLISYFCGSIVNRKGEIMKTRRGKKKLFRKLTDDHIDYILRRIVFRINFCDEKIKRAKRTKIKFIFGV